MVGEDATRTEPDFLCRCVEAAIKAGATTINMPDTVGYTVPEEMYDTIKMLRERVPDADKAIFSMHCHNDLGLAVANSLAGVRAGARQIECTINGIGERAGNASLEEVVMAIQTRNDVLPYWTGIDTTMLTRASQLVSAVHRLPGAVQQGDRRPQRLRARERHPPGRHAQAHPDLRDHDAGERRREAAARWSWASIPAGTPSRTSSKDLGYDLGDNQLEDAFVRFKDAGRPQEARLRRGHRGAGRRGDRDRAGPHQAASRCR